jgi:hypothetical protein
MTKTKTPQGRPAAQKDNAIFQPAGAIRGSPSAIKPRTPIINGDLPNVKP